MKKFAVLTRQCGEGCDYTIGCGMKWEFVNAESVTQVLEYIVWPDGRNEISTCSKESDFELAEIIIIPIENDIYKVNMEIIKKQVQEIEQRKIDNKLKNEELKELERLKAKYESKQKG